MPDSDYEQIFTYSITQKKLSFKVFKIISFAMYATSGKGEDMNNFASTHKQDKGPIPTGEYIIYPNELTDEGFWGDIKNLKNGDWGDWFVPLHPLPGTNTFGRSGFYIHGGMREGSAGCIDIGGLLFGNKETTFVEDIIIKTKKPILLRVIQ